MTPLLTVLVTSWNAGGYIVNCLHSVLKSDYPNLEIILIDNHSDDISMELVRAYLTAEELRRVKIIVNDKNYGCPYLENQGITLAGGKYMSVICSDSKVNPSYFSEVVKVLESDDSIGAVSAKSFIMDKPLEFDSVGEYLSQYGILIQRHADQEIDKGQFNEQVEIFSIKGSAFTARLDVLREIGGFPQDYFTYLEETDVCWRIWLAGYRIVFVPKAIVYHAHGTSINKFPRFSWLVKFCGTKNYIYTLIKNLGFKNLLHILPLNIIMWLGLAFYMLIRGRFKDSWYITCGVFWNLLNLGYVLKKRKEVQGMRIISDKELMPKIMRKVSIRYLIDRAFEW